MTYSELGVLGVIIAVVLDLAVFRTGLIRRRVFWKSYAIIISFQLLTNGVLTGFRIVRYSGDAIVGSSTPANAAPPFVGDGRIAFAPIEDLLFGFSLILLTLVLWVWLGSIGIGRTPMAGPPHPALRRFTK